MFSECNLYSLFFLPSEKKILLALNKKKHVLLKGLAKVRLALNAKN